MRTSCRRPSTHTRATTSTRSCGALAASRGSDEDELNGFPAVNHGVEDCRRLIRALDAPVEVRHGTPDARLLAMVTLAGGFQSLGTPICRQTSKIRTDTNSDDIGRRSRHLWTSLSAVLQSTASPSVR